MKKRVLDPDYHFLKFVTAFTVGHSIALILATFMKITADYFLVDAVIASSVCYKAFDNLDGFRKHLKTNPPNPMGMILVFGLIHGFGLSTRLQRLPLPEKGLLTRILSFNAGVGLFIFQMSGYFRGEGHHDQEPHGAEERSHSHDAKGPSPHRERADENGVGNHSH